MRQGRFIQAARQLREAYLVKADPNLKLSIEGWEKLLGSCLPRYAIDADKWPEINRAIGRVPEPTDSQRLVGTAWWTFAVYGILPTHNALMEQLKQTTATNRVPDERSVRFIIKRLKLPMAHALRK